MSATAARAGLRPKLRSSPRSRAVTQPVPNISPARVVPLMCGIPYESYVTVTSLRPTGSFVVLPIGLKSSGR